MSSARFLVATAVVLCSSACSGVRPAVGSPTRSTAEALLVTLRPTPAGSLGGAASTSDAYAPPSDYTVSQHTRRTVRALVRDHRLISGDGWTIRALGLYCFVVYVPADRSLGTALAELEADARVESVQPLQRFRTLGTDATHDDPYLDLQHGLADIRALEAHAWADGSGVTIAVIDTEVDRSHPDLEESISAARDFVPNARSRPEAHGTAIASIIAAEADNGLGTVGVAPGARILALRACWEEGSEGRCDSFTLAQALSFAIDEAADVVNLSLSGPSDPLLERLVRAALARGTAVVAARPADLGAPAFPTSLAGVMVAGLPSTGEDGPILGAPGREILAATPGTGFDFVSGTSFSAAHLSGALALLLQRAPRAPSPELQRVLSATARWVPDAPSAGDRSRLIDVCEALDRLTGRTRCTESGLDAAARASSGATD